ncbi:MAG TPA: aminomethyl-transferring glycine dehydrogenase subunit GcvPA [Chloroflexia bacterium]|nr:aminomethyl-transferring glycine dehydrogenase subunit GcvPA [Chloroflexia bacterium]
MPYIPNTDADRQAMLASLGMQGMADLYREVPAQVMDPQITLPDPLSEAEIMAEMRRLSEKNCDAAHFATFLGAGSYNHFSPSAVYRIMSRGEFYTAYTPYQPELSQGTIQWTYEWQTLICELTGMDVANAGMWDASTAMAEAAIMATNITKRKTVVIGNGVHPQYREVLATYAPPHGVTVQPVAGPHDLDALGPDVACVILQQPNFIGTINDLNGIAAKVHAAGALFILVFDPISLGLIKAPGELDVDIAIGEGQSLGAPQQFGGPYSGMMAVKEKYTRSLPGRLAGMTRDTRDGKRGFVLTLQTREQHIRREKATSNICTNSALIALANTAYLALMGKYGLRRVAEICYNRSHYLADQITQLPGFTLKNEGPFFKEFLVETPMPPGELNHRLLEHHIIGGLDVSDQYPNGWLLCVTEMNSREQLDNLVAALRSITGAEGTEA